MKFMRYLENLRILKKICKILINNPAAIIAVCDNSTNYKRYVEKKYGLINGLPVIIITELLPDFSEEISPLSMLGDGSSPIDYALLKALAKKFNCCKYLEVGTWRGESIAIVADVADECYSISLSEDDLKKMGFNEKDILILDFFSKKLKNVVHIKANSLSFDFNSLQKKFNLIFIDGDHDKNSIESDTRNAFNLLKDDKSIIIWHDYGITPERIRWETLAGIMDGTPAEYRDNIYQVSNTLCAIFIKGVFNTKPFHFPEIPRNIFEVKIQVKSI